VSSKYINILHCFCSAFTHWAYPSSTRLFDLLCFLLSTKLSTVLCVLIQCSRQEFSFW